MMGFPHEAVPDGTILGPHHLYIGVAVVAVVAMTVWDDDRRDPLLVVSGIIVSSVFGFALSWPHYPVVGALLTLTGLAASTLALARPYWREYRFRAVAVAVGLAVAWDDAVSHAFGVWTPLDWIWIHHIYPYMA